MVLPLGPREVVLVSTGGATVVTVSVRVEGAGVVTQAVNANAANAERTIKTNLFVIIKSSLSEVVCKK